MVRRAREDEIGAVAGILHDAFAHEAGLNYWLRQGARKEPAPDFTGFFGLSCLRQPQADEKGRSGMVGRNRRRPLKGELRSG